MEGVLKIQSVLAGAVSLAALALIAAPVQAATELFNFQDNVDGIFVMGSFTTSDTANANGTFDIMGITGTVMNANNDPAHPLVDQISMLIANPGQPNPTVADGFQYDNVTPLNTNGVLFEGGSGAIYNLWSNGGPSNAANGEFYTYGGPVPSFDAHGTLSVGPVPEPAAWAMMLVGFGALGGALRYSRRKQALAAA